MKHKTIHLHKVSPVSLLILGLMLIPSINGASALGTGPHQRLNDQKRGDARPNDLEKALVLKPVSFNGDVMIIQGTLNNTAHTTFTLDFFANAADDLFVLDRAGEFIGSAAVTTDAHGYTSFTVAFPTTVAFGRVITATATGPFGGTVESHTRFELLCLIDDRTGMALLINIDEGEYTLFSEEGKITGSVALTARGTMITFQSAPDDENLLQGGVDLRRRVANARLQVPRGGTQVFAIVDSDIDDNICVF
jgi:hypothetical protein